MQEHSLRNCVKDWRLLLKTSWMYVICVCVYVLLWLCPTLCDPVDPTRLLCPWNFPFRNTGVGCHFLLQGIFSIQGLNLGLLLCRQILYHLSHYLKLHNS